MNTIFPTEDEGLYFNKNLKDLLNERLKPSLVSGYSKSSVQQFVEELYKSSEQMKVSLEKQIQDLLGEKAALSQECNILRQQLSEAEKKSIQQKHELDAYLESRNEDTGKIENQLSQLKSENYNLSLQLSQAQEAQKLYHSLEAKLADKEKELAEKESQLSELSQQLSASMQRIKMLEEQVNVLNQQKDANSKAIERTEEIEQMSAEIKALKKQESELNNRIALEQEKAFAAEKTAKEATMKLESMMSRLSTLEKQETEFNERIAAEQQRAAVAEEAAKEATKKLEFLQSQLEQKQTQIHDLEEKYRELQKAQEALEQKYDTLHRNYTSTVQKNDTLSAEKEALSDLLQKYQRKEQKYALLQKQNEEYRKSIFAFDAAIKLLLQEMENQMQLFQNTVDQYHEGEAQIHDLVQEKTQLQIKNVDLLDQISVLTANLSKAEQECKRLTRMIRFSKNDVDITQEDLDDDFEEAQVFDLKTTADGTDEFVANAVKKAKEISKIYTLDKQVEAHSSAK